MKHRKKPRTHRRNVGQQSDSAGPTDKNELLSTTSCGGIRKIRAMLNGHEELRAVLRRMGIPIPPTDFRAKAHSPPKGQLCLPV